MKFYIFLIKFKVIFLHTTPLCIAAKVGFSITVKHLLEHPNIDVNKKILN